MMLMVLVIVCFLMYTYINQTKAYVVVCFQIGVILQSFGAGNIPSNRSELMDIFREAHEVHNILILNTTQCWKGTVSGIYATGAILETVGAISGRVSSCPFPAIVTFTIVWLFHATDYSFDI